MKEHSAGERSPVGAPHSRLAGGCRRTGGFLVAALDHVRKTASETQLEKFKRLNVFGIEQESYVAALAIVNMMFRGDGKNNISEANCFSTYLRRATVNGHASAEYLTKAPPRGEEPVTRVFMNPPFALKQSDEKESRFVEAALTRMADGGLLFAIVPMSVMSEGGKDGGWRRDTLLAHHTLLAVISLPEELFYPIANQTVAIVVRKGTPHSKNQPVFWGRIVNDGFQKSKGRRLPAPPTAPNDLKTITPILRGFLLHAGQPVTSVPEFVSTAPADYSDPILELVPEAYLESRVPDRGELLARLDQQVRENVAALVDVDLRYAAGGSMNIIDAAGGLTPAPPKPLSGPWRQFQLFSLESLFELHPGDYHSLGEVDRGSALMASCADSGNGIIGKYEVPAVHIYRDALTIAFNGWPLTTKIHPYAFAAKDDVAVAIPKRPLPPEALVFIQAALNSERWRFSYYRKCFRAKLGRTAIELPVNQAGELDIDFMVATVQAQPYWWFLAPRLSGWNPTRPTEGPAAESADVEAAAVGNVPLAVEN